MSESEARIEATDEEWVLEDGYSHLHAGQDGEHIFISTYPTGLGENQYCDAGLDRSQIESLIAWLTARLDRLGKEAAHDDS